MVWYLYNYLDDIPLKQSDFLVHFLNCIKPNNRGIIICWVLGKSFHESLGEIISRRHCQMKVLLTLLYYPNYCYFFQVVQRLCLSLLMARDRNWMRTPCALLIRNLLLMAYKVFFRIPGPPPISCPSTFHAFSCSTALLFL